VVSNVRNWVRGALHLKKARKKPRRGAKPAIGASICNADLRMTIQAGFGDDLWQWLADSGWREVTYRPDRRLYREIPATWVTRLIDAPAGARRRVLGAAVDKATVRPDLYNRGILQVYATRE
jgi:hypothetical protein